MSSNPTSRDADSTNQFDDIVADFEAAWEAHLRGRGPQPIVTRLLPAGRPLRCSLGLELAAIDLERRLKRGENVRLETYLEQLPELRKDRRAVQALIRTEYEYRLGAERALLPDEYAARFPDCFDPVLDASLRG